VAPGVLDSRRCISYHTIENRSDIPRELRAGMGQWLFGCDVCQEVCPWNRFEVEANDETLWPRPDADPVELIELLSLDEDQFREKFRKTPLWRPRRRGILRNAAVCLGNARDARAVEPLMRLLHDPEPLIRVATVWALGQIGDAAGLRAVADLANHERDASVMHEIRLTLADAGHPGTPQQ
jgi:epoxyqueuosine reductase